MFFLWGELSLQPFLAPDWTLARYAGDKSVVIEGVVDERPAGTVPGGQRLLVRVARLFRGKEEIPASGRILVHVKEGRARLATGDRILFSSRITVPRNYGLPGEPDYPRRLAYQRVYAVAFVKEAEELLLVRAGEGWRHRVDRLSAELGDFITATVPRTEAGVLKALLLGDRGDVPEPLSDAYALSGVNHILSISGFHIGIIFLFIFQLLFMAARHSEFLVLRFNLRKALLFAALPVVVFYLFLSGGAAATQRSVLMIAALVAALQVKREVDPVNAVLLAALGILSFAPQTLFEVSFQLSFLAIWGLVVLAPLLSQLLVRLPLPCVPLRWLFLLLTASAAAVLATLVPVAYYFQQVSLIGLVANLVIVPLLGYGAVIAGFASLPLIPFLPVAAGGLIRLAAFLVSISDAAICYLARAPALTWYVPGRLDFMLSCLLMGALSFLKPALRLPVSLALLALLLVRAAPTEAAGDGQLHVTFLSVGQGDATLVRLPDGKWMLVDGGGRAGDLGSRVGERLLLPALRRLGVRRIDYLVLSHEHPDHLQGVLFLAAHFEVGEFWESGIRSELPEYLQLKWLLAARGIPVRSVHGSLAPLQVGGARVEPLWPPDPAGGGYGGANDSSLVLRLRHGRSAVLLPGDIGVKEERELLARGAPLHCTLLKVAHHGSRYSTSDPFLDAASPEAAVISAGYGNPFRLPAPGTVERLQKRGIRLYRTDLDGTVQAVCRPDGTLSLSTPWGAF